MRILRTPRSDLEVLQYHQHEPHPKSNPPKFFLLDLQTLAHFLDHQSVLRLQESHFSRVLYRLSSQLRLFQLVERPVFSPTWSKGQSLGEVVRLRAKLQNRSQQLEELAEAGKQR
jgi:hypothetical protein